MHTFYVLVFIYEYALESNQLPQLNIDQTQTYLMSVGS